MLYQLNNIAFAYDTKFGLTNINLEIEIAEIVAIVGPNGAGKTSLLNILAFLTLPTLGELQYNGSPLMKSNVLQFKKTVAYVQQNPYLMRGTAYKNIELGLKLRGIDKAQRIKRITKVMDLLAISDLANRSARSLSGGEAQRIAIAQGLVLEPTVLVLDEPFTYLDQTAIYDLEQLLLALRDEHQKTIIFTTHNHYQAEYLSNRTYSMIGGQLFATPLTNLFNGHINNDYFDTGKLKIAIPTNSLQAQHIVIDPKQIVLSKEPLTSSMQNSYPGKIMGISEQAGQFNIQVAASEEFKVIVTHQALIKLELSIGIAIWISFKSSSVHLF